MEVFEESLEGAPVNLPQPGPVNPVKLAESLVDQLDSWIIAAGMYPDQFGKDYD
jgi:hypothetical protein